MREFLSTWEWPHGVGKTQLLEIFEPGRVSGWRKAGHTKCHASEPMSLLPVFSYFATHHAQGQATCSLDTNAFVAVIDMCEAFHLRKTDLVDTAYAHARVLAFLDACTAAGWNDRMHPKFHWLVHLAAGLVISALVCEGKHRLPKRFARELKNLTNFDVSVLANTTSHHMAQLSVHDSLTFDVALVEPRPAPKRLLAFLTSTFGNGNEYKSSIKTMLKGHGSCDRGDVVLVDDGYGMCAAEIWALCSINGGVVALASIWDTMASSSEQTGSAKWLEVQNPGFYPAEYILCACIYKRYPSGVVTLVPPQHRWRLR